MNKVWLFFTFLIFLIQFINPKERNWLNILSKYIPQKINPYQVLIINQDYHSNRNKIEQIILKLEQKIPLWCLDSTTLTEKHIQHLKNLPVFQNPRRTTLFLVIKTSENSEESSVLRSDFMVVMSYITRLSGA